MCRLLRLLLREADLAGDETEGIGVEFAHGCSAYRTTEENEKRCENEGNMWSRVERRCPLWIRRWRQGPLNWRRPTPSQVFYPLLWPVSGPISTVTHLRPCGSDSE